MEGAGFTVGGLTGMEGRVSFGGPGFMRVGFVAPASAGSFIGAPAVEGFPRAATCGGIAAGELLVPV